MKNISCPLLTSGVTVYRTCSDMEILMLSHRLRQLPTGSASATEYQDISLKILAYLFPELVEPKVESANSSRTERRDIIFYNSSNCGFWHDIKMKHGSTHIVFEIKNTFTMTTSHINQISSYLKDSLGHFGVILGRGPHKKNVHKKAQSAFSDHRNALLSKIGF